MKRLLLSLLVLALAMPARAEDKKDPSKSDLPVTAKLTAKKDSYKLELGGKSAEEFTKAIKEGKGAKPKPPAVDLVLEITNTSDKDVEIWTTGDPVTVDLELKGPGALSVASGGIFTLEFRIPKAITLAAGKSHTIPITSLSYGSRGASMFAYWTEPGEYTLSATFNTALKPAPKGSKVAEGGFGVVAVKSGAVKIKVEK
jgi:hypothetical protein